VVARPARPDPGQLPDGDFLDLDFSDGDPRLPLVVVLHGLEGSARSTYALEMYRVLAAREIQAVGLNFRSCSGDLNRTPRLYHSGETGDLAHVLGMLRERFPGRRMGAVGFSLGGNVLLKYLGEAAGAAGAAAAVAISVPFDLAAGAVYLERGFARAYRRYLVRKLQRKTRAAVAANPMLRAAFTQAGGHVGFVAGPPWAPVFWAERRAAGFLAEQLHGET